VIPEGESGGGQGFSRRHSGAVRAILYAPDQPRHLPIFSSPGVMQIVVEGREGSRLGKE
jgi:hypothetical protein